MSFSCNFSSSSSGPLMSTVVVAGVMLKRLVFMVEVIKVMGTAGKVRLDEFTNGASFNECFCDCSRCNAVSMVSHVNAASSSESSFHQKLFTTISRRGMLFWSCLLDGGRMLEFALARAEPFARCHHQPMRLAAFHQDRRQKSPQFFLAHPAHQLAFIRIRNQTRF